MPRLPRLDKSGKASRYNAQNFPPQTSLLSAEIKSHLTELLTQSLARVAPQFPASIIALERPKQAAHGDWACNVAMQLAKQLKRNPRDLAQALIAALPASPWLDSAELAGPGFINLRLKAAAKLDVIRVALVAGRRYGHADAAHGRPVLVEFVSANPTGPLHVGHGRQAALGDAISALLEAQKWKVTREFYYNDAGAQFDNLTLSVQLRCKGLTPEDSSWPEGGYRGDYIIDVANAYMAKEPVESDGPTRFAEMPIAGGPSPRLLPQSAGSAITSDLASVVGSPSRMASSFISNVSQPHRNAAGRPQNQCP